MMIDSSDERFDGESMEYKFELIWLEDMLKSSKVL